MPPNTACPCCKAAMVEIGEDRSERLDVITGAIPRAGDAATQICRIDVRPIVSTVQVLTLDLRPS
jgi:transposase